MMKELRRGRSDEHERALWEAELRATTASAQAVRLERAFDAVALAVVVYDETGQVALRNRQSRELQSSRHIAALVNAVVDELLTTARGGRRATRTLELHGPPPRSLVITAAPLDHGGSQVGTVVIIDDVSERSRLDAVRRDFVASVSHELRTPVGALSLLAEALAEEEDPVTTHRLVARITAEAERAGRMIEDLLDLSRIEAEGVQKQEAVRLEEVAAAAAHRVAALASRRNVEIVIVEVAPVSSVVGDEGQLLSAVANLLDNAVKYSDTGSTVEVEMSEKGGWVEVAVRDHGIGIPPSDLERIFERFYRVDRARSRETGGTGLGLSIVRHVAINHGGEVRVTSREGEGSTFTLRLPVTLPTPTP